MTIRELATHCGVSNATVSLALRGHPRISPATRERIARMAEDLGYRANPLVSALLTHVRARQSPRFQEVLGVLSTQALPGRRQTPYNRAVIEGIIDRVAHLGFGVDFFPADGSVGARRLDQVLASRGIRGLIIDPSCQDAPVPELAWENLSCVRMTYAPAERRARRVLPDQYHNMEDLLQELDARGYRRIGFYNLARFEDRVHGHWSAAFIRYQFDLPARRRVPLKLSEDWRHDAFVAWARRTRPDAIVCPHWGAAAWLREAGFSVPEEIGVAAPNWSPLHPQVGGIDQNAADIGAAAVDIVASQLSRNEAGLQTKPRLTLIPGQFREGATLRPRPVPAPRSALSDARVLG